MTLSPNLSLSSSRSISSLSKSVKRKSDDENQTDESSSSQTSSDSINCSTPTKTIQCTNKQRQVFPNDEFYVCTIGDRDYFVQKQATAAAPLWQSLEKI